MPSLCGRSNSNRKSSCELVVVEWAAQSFRQCRSSGVRTFASTYRITASSFSHFAFTFGAEKGAVRHVVETQECGYINMRVITSERCPEGDHKSGSQIPNSGPQKPKVVHRFQKAVHENQLFKLLTIIILTM